MLYFRGVLICLVLCGADRVFAQEAFLNGGFVNQIHSGEKSYAWSVEYFEGLSEHAELSFSWINEGHVTNHHRDGNAAQIWLRRNLMDRRLSIKAGIGPYQYYDTTGWMQDGGYVDAHGWGVVCSMAACWYSDSPWIVQFQTNYINTFHSIDTTSAVFGVGYQLDRPRRPGPRIKAATQTAYTTDQEVTVFLGQTVVNSLNSEQSVAKSVEYRRGLSPHIDGTVAWIDEGDERLVRRNGIASQLWLTRGFYDNHLALGVGAGVYYSIDMHKNPVGSEASGNRLAGLVTITGSYRFAEHWLTRLSWNRVVTDYNQDTDIFMLGLGYRFAHE